MDGTDLARRKALQASVAALCVEIGFVSADKDSLGALSEMLQSYITELGRTSRLYCELAQRTEPTVSDVQLALIDAGADVNALPQYAKRPQRRHLHRQSKNFPQPPPKCLQVGAKVQRPSNIPSHLPAFPDPHTYIRTPVYATPSSDYKVVREKLASQKRDSRKSLSGLLAKTRPSHPVAGESDPRGHYTVVKVEPTDCPAYLQALLPTQDDQNTSKGEADSEDSSDVQGVVTKGSEVEQMETSLDSRSMDCSMESYDNPYLKTPKRAKP